MRQLPWIAALANLGLFFALGLPQKSALGGMRLNELAQLPIVDGGRMKPLDTFARVNLQVISVRQELRDEQGKKLTAVEWLLDVWSDPRPFDGPAAKHRVFRIENDQLLNVLGLEQRPGSYRYSMKELRPRFDTLWQEYLKARRVDDRTRDTYQKQVVSLAQHLELYDSILRLRLPLLVPPPAAGEEWQAVGASLEPARRHFTGFLVEEMQRQGRRPQDMSRADIADIEGRIDQLAIEKLTGNDPASAFFRLVRSYAGGDAAAFNDALVEMSEKAREQSSAWDYRMTRFESAFNRLAPFYVSMFAYLGVVLLATFSWLSGADSLRRTALAVGASTFLVHTLALLARMAIQWRPPVTNLYSSAIFIGWGCAGLLLLLEVFYRNGIAVFLSGITAALSLVVAHFLSLSGDTLEMMQAVLDTNFWLATHVTAVTLGYTATFVAGFLGAAYVLLGFATPWLDAPLSKRLTSMTYGTVCFATLLSFVGTVLGGIWADQSWGRFWGWDSKENGAVLVVIWNALILHARWAGLVKQQGIALLAVFGNVVTAWSWFGTNQLGVGLHSYGWNSGVAKWLVIFDLAMMAIIVAGCTPRRLWPSQALANSSSSQRSRTPVGTSA